MPGIGRGDEGEGVSWRRPEKPLEGRRLLEAHFGVWPSDGSFRPHVGRMNARMMLSRSAHNLCGSVWALMNYWV